MGWGGSKRKRRFALSAAHRYLRPDLIANSCKDLLTLKSFLPVSCSHFEVLSHYISPSLRASSLPRKAGLWRTRWQRKGPSSTPNSRSLYLSPGFSSCPHALEALFWKALSFCSCSTSPPQVFQSIIVSFVHLWFPDIHLQPQTLVYSTVCRDISTSQVQTKLFISSPKSGPTSLPSPPPVIWNVTTLCTYLTRPETQASFLFKDLILFPF